MRLNIIIMHSQNRYKESKVGKYQNEDAWISDLDPILQNGFKIAFFEPQFAVQIRTHTQDGNQTSTKELLNLRILSSYSSEGISDLKIELSSEQDLFKLYICHIDDKKFERIKKAQHLNFNFQNLLTMLTKQISLSQKNVNQYSSVLYLNKISLHRLDLLQNIEYKRIELLSMEFEEPDDEFIKNYATFRFTKVKMNKQIVQKKIKDVMSMTKLKNQNLYFDIIKKQGLKTLK